MPGKSVKKVQNLAKQSKGVTKKNDADDDFALLDEAQSRMQSATLTFVKSLIEKKKLSEALRETSQAIGSFSQESSSSEEFTAYVQLHVARAQCNLELFNTDLARADVNKVLSQLDTENIDAMLLLGSVHQETYNYQETVKICEQIEAKVNAASFKKKMNKEQLGRLEGLKKSCSGKGDVQHFSNKLIQLQKRLQKENQSSAFGPAPYVFRVLVGGKLIQEPLRVSDEKLIGEVRKRFQEAVDRKEQVLIDKLFKSVFLAMSDESSLMAAFRRKFSTEGGKDGKPIISLAVQSQMKKEFGIEPSLVDSGILARKVAVAPDDIFAPFGNSEVFCALVPNPNNRKKEVSIFASPGTPPYLEINSHPFLWYLKKITPPKNYPRLYAAVEKISDNGINDDNVESEWGRIQQAAAQYSTMQRFRIFMLDGCYKWFSDKHDGRIPETFAEHQETWAYGDAELLPNPHFASKQQETESCDEALPAAEAKLSRCDLEAMLYTPYLSLEEEEEISKKKLTFRVKTVSLKTLTDEERDQRAELLRAMSVYWIAPCAGCEQPVSLIRPNRKYQDYLGCHCRQRCLCSVECLNKELKKQKYPCACDIQDAEKQFSLLPKFWRELHDWSWDRAARGYFDIPGEPRRMTERWDEVVYPRYLKVNPEATEEELETEEWRYYKLSEADFVRDLCNDAWMHVNQYAGIEDFPSTVPFYETCYNNHMLAQAKIMTLYLFLTFRYSYPVETDSVVRRRIKKQLIRTYVDDGLFKHISPAVPMRPPSADQVDINFDTVPFEVYEKKTMTTITGEVIGGNKVQSMD